MTSEGGIPPSPSPETLPGYPFAAPLPGLILRPLQQPIFDSEWVEKGKPVAALTFMRRVFEQKFAVESKGKKTLADTSLLPHANGGLPQPYEFSVFGFSMYLDCPDWETRRCFLRGSVFRFMYCSNRIYLTIPTVGIPDVEKPQELLESLVIPFRKKDADGNDEKEKTFYDEKKTREAELEAAGYEQYMAALKEDGASKILYKFTIGRSALRIRPTKSFGVEILWPGEAWVPPCDMKVTVFMNGLMWTPL